MQSIQKAFMEKKKPIPQSEKRSRDNLILSMLKKTGRLAPTTKREVDDYEAFFGKTKIDLPEDLDNPDFLFKHSQIGSKESDPFSEKENCDEPKIVSISEDVNKKTRNDYFKKVVLAAEIAFELHEEPTFGRKKFVKVYYVCEEVCNMNLSTNYGKYAAGPLDPKNIYTIEAEFKRKNWFTVAKRKSGYGFSYSLDTNVEEYKKYYPRYFKHEANSISHVINLFRKKDSGFCEIVATMYCVWKKALSENITIDDDELIKRFYNWGEEKSKFIKNQLLDTLEWMKKEQIVPLI
jgi:hypothetical protein